MKIEVLSEFSYLIRFPGDKTCLPEPTGMGIAAQLIRDAFNEDWVEVVPVFCGPFGNVVRTIFQRWR